MKFRTKLISYGLGSVILFMLFFSVYAGFWYSNYYHSEINNTRNLLIQERKHQLKSLIDNLVYAYNLHYVAYKEGKITKAELESYTVSLSKDLRYDNKKGYYFIIDSKAFMISDPAKPSVNGKNLYNFHDKKGNYLFQDMIKVTNRYGSGYVQYWWEKPGFGVSPKLTYVSKLKGLGWIIGTGVYIDDIDRQVAMKRQNFLHKIYSSIIVSIIIALAILIIVFILGAVVSNKLIAPLKKLSNHIKQLSTGNGDLTVRLPVETKDEFGELANDINKFLDYLQTIIGKTQGLGKDLAENTATLATSAEEMSSTVEEQTQTMDEVTNAVNDANQALSGVAQSTENISNNAEDMSQSMDASLSAIEERAKRMQTTVSNIEDAVSKISVVSESSKQIGGIVNVISEITDQTNLLALNAAIEAARAGNAGRGFAVVADEVRKLAEKTQNATQEIAEMVHAMQANTKKAVDITDIIKNNTLEEAEFEQKDRDILKELSGKVDRVINEINTTSAATEELSSTFAEIEMQIKDINEASKENAKVVEGVASMAINLGDSTKELDTTIGQFKV